MRRSSIGVCVVVCALALSGCGTFVLEPMGRTLGGLAGGGHGGARVSAPMIYGGVRTWFDLLRGGEAVLLFPLFLIDFPLCLVADTLILPYTIAANSDRRPAAKGPRPKPPPRRDFAERVFAPPNPAGARFKVRLSHWTDEDGMRWVQVSVTNLGKVELRAALSCRGQRLAETKLLRPGQVAEVRERADGALPASWRDVRLQVQGRQGGAHRVPTY